MKGSELGDALAGPTEGRWVDKDRLYHHLLHLHNMQAIRPAEYRTLYKQLNSPDRENHVMAEEVISQLIRNL